MRAVPRARPSKLNMYHRVLASRTLLFATRPLASSTRCSVISPYYALLISIHFNRSFSCSRPAFLNSLDTFSDDEEMFRDSGTPQTLLV